jgi:hypothetical protein
VFDLRGIERISNWKSFRDYLEHSNHPFEDCNRFWSKAPLVNPYLNIENPDSWPDPWQLILDNRYDDLAITLGKLYTLQLTDRFMESHFEIYMSSTNIKDTIFYLLVNNRYLLGYECIDLRIEDFSEKNLIRVPTKSEQNKYHTI